MSTNTSTGAGAGILTVRLGTRASSLALAQSRMVARDLRTAAARTGAVLRIELVTVRTRGDVDPTALARLGGAGVFAAALRTALLDGECDLAVHSFKDLPTAKTSWSGRSARHRPPGHADGHRGRRNLRKFSHRPHRPVASASQTRGMSQTAPSPAPLRVVLYSHDSLGLGHLRRNLALAHALAQDLPALSGRDVAGLLVRGLTPGVDLPLPPGFDWLTLPGVAKGPGGYEPRHLGTGTADLLALRSALLETALTCFGPDLVVIDRHPYGVHRELLAPLRRLRRARPSCQVVLGLREVLDSPGCVQAEWHRLGDTGELRHLIDHVWVYGDPAVHDLRRSGEAPTALADRITYTGYLAAGRARTGLFASVGQAAGGEDGGIVGERGVQFGDGRGIRAFLWAKDGAGAVRAAERVIDVAGDVEGDGL